VKINWFEYIKRLSQNQTHRVDSCHKIALVPKTLIGNHASEKERKVKVCTFSIKTNIPYEKSPLF
jgi:hypothetical protein